MNSSDQIEAERRGFLQSDDQFTNSKEHQVAMAARCLISGLADLSDLAETREGAMLVRNELGDLALAHARFGRLLRDLYVRKVA